MPNNSKLKTGSKQPCPLLVNLPIIERLRSYRYSDNRGKRWLHAFLSKSWLVARCTVDARLRSEIITGRLYARERHQRSSYTEPDRYPELFAACALYFSTRPEVRILSFGCSTGEEVVALRSYLPQAQIIGVDINRWCLRRCRRRITDPNTLFLHRFSRRFADCARFDAIFCMAVFQNPDNRNAADNRLATRYRFERFASEIALLDAKLKPGGLLVIDHCDFSFADTACSTRYTPLNFEANVARHERPLYSRDNRKVTEAQELLRIFVKLRD